MSIVNETFIIEPLFLTGESATWTACTGVYTNALFNCDGEPMFVMESGSTIFSSNLVPKDDGIYTIGTPVKRFRDLNTVSGTTSYWTSTNYVKTPSLDLGLDSDGNQRTITANNSIIQDDILIGGNY
jgi:hypothetical protein